jgi:hypothetical protein
MLTSVQLVELAVKCFSVCATCCCDGEKGEQGSKGEPGVCECVCACTAQNFNFNLNPGVDASQAGYQKAFFLPDNSGILLAMAYNNAGDPVVLSTLGTGDTGLGIWENANHYLDTDHFIQFDMADIIRTRDDRCPATSLTVSHVCTGYGYEVYGSNTKGDIGNLITAEGPNGNPFTNEGEGCIARTAIIPSFEMGDYIMLYGTVPPYRYISVRATAGEVVVGAITVSKCEF